MARGRGWGLLVGGVVGVAAAWGVVAGRRWLRRRYQGRKGLHGRAYAGYEELAGDVAAFWRDRARLRRLRNGLLAERALLARLLVVAVRASQCACLEPVARRAAGYLGQDEGEIARLEAGDLAIAELAQVQALLTAVRFGEAGGDLDADVLAELRSAYGEEKAFLIVDWLDLVGIAIRAGHTWDLALARLSGARRGSALRPLATVAMAFLGGLPLMAWGIVWRGSFVEATSLAGQSAPASPPAPTG
ncbi:MAG: hypothetical protein ACOX2R_02750 [Anaerolineae bacterium]|jgi:hypothetical protein